MPKNAFDPKITLDYRFVTKRLRVKEDFSTNFVLQQKVGMRQKKVIRGKLSSKLSGSFINIKMKSPMTPHDFFSY